MSHYKNTQIGYVTGGIATLAAVLVYYSFRADNVEGLGWFGTSMVVLCAGAALLFSSLTVEVDDEEVRFYFGPGFWTRHIPLRDITRVEEVRNSPLAGWGIRYTVHGWLYNVSGLHAVELDVEGQGSIRVGTDEPQRLKAAIDEARQQV